MMLLMMMRRPRRTSSDGVLQLKLLYVIFMFYVSDFVISVSVFVSLLCTLNTVVHLV
jgi:hypothetical protein